MKLDFNSTQMDGFRTMKVIPLVIRYAAGTPSIVQNPANEAITLTDTGTGNLKMTLATAAVAPLMAQALVLSTDAATLGLNVNLLSAPTTSVVELFVNSDADGITAVDPVDLHVVLYKQIKA